MADSTLNAIRLKVRRLTRNPSAQQLTDANIDEYVNTFIKYDFPEHIRLFNLKSQFTFFTQPYIDTYQTTQIAGDQFQNWDNLNLTISEPIFIGGYRAYFSQDRDQFFSIYPLTNYLLQVAVGDGVTNIFNGNINLMNAGFGTPQMPILRNQVTVDSIDANLNGMVLSDVPQLNTQVGNLVSTTAPNAGMGTINYVTGAYTITWNVPPGPGQPINFQVVPYQPTIPTAFLFYDGQITLRPVPDQAYRVNMEVYIPPTQLLNAGQSPQLEEWWQYIAYGAAKKVFEDKQDLASVQMIMPEYKAQEALCLRRTIVQQTSTRSATIFTEQTSLGSLGSGGGWGGPF